MYYVIASGKKKSKIGESAIENVCKKLEERHVDFKILVSAYGGHTFVLAKEASEAPDCDAIIAVGGDGHFYEVLNGMDTKRVPIGFVPAGTGNDFARTLGISVDIDECLDNIIGKTPQYVDYMRIGNYKAFNVVGSGFDIVVLEKEIELRKSGKYNDKSSYKAALMHTIMHCKFHKLKFRLDEGEWREEDILMMDCSNGIWGGGKLPLCIGADPFDGYIDFKIIKKFPKIGLLPLLLKFQKGKLEKSKYIEHVLCKKVEIDMEPRLKVNLDGELLDIFPTTVEIVHDELKFFPSQTPPRDPYELLKDKKAA